MKLLTLKQYCLDGGGIICFIDEDNEWAFRCASPEDDNLSDEQLDSVISEIKTVVNKASFMPRDPEAYVRYICKKCDCCDDILLVKQETLVIA